VQCLQTGTDGLFENRIISRLKAFRLSKIHVSYDVVEVEQTAYGTDYVFEGALSTPDGRNPIVRTVWFLEAGAAIPRFNTAYPKRRRAS
jgi:hypothetical protein